MNEELKKIDSVVYCDDYTNCYAFKIENVELLDEPIKVNGKLGLWNYEEK